MPSVCSEQLARRCRLAADFIKSSDLDSISDESERAASVGIIHNFGQTPHQIFALGHPQRFLNGISSLPIGQRFGVDEHYAVLIRSALPVAESSVSGHDICHAPTLEMPPVMAPHGRVFHPDIPSCSLRYGFSDQSIRGYFGMTRVSPVSLIRQWFETS